MSEIVAKIVRCVESGDIEPGPGWRIVTRKDLAEHADVLRLAALLSLPIEVDRHCPPGGVYVLPPPEESYFGPANRGWA